MKSRYSQIGIRGKSPRIEIVTNLPDHYVFFSATGEPVVTLPETSSSPLKNRIFQPSICRGELLVSVGENLLLFTGIIGATGIRKIRWVFESGKLFPGRKLHEVPSESWYYWWKISHSQPPFGCIKPCKHCDKLPINWCRILAIDDISRNTRPSHDMRPETFSWLELDTSQIFL